MSKEKIFKQLITEMARDGEVSPSEYAILIEKGKDLGIAKSSVDLLIKLELADFSDNKYDSSSEYNNNQSNEIEETYSFRSAITRGGQVLTPDRIEIEGNNVIFKKRNKYLINVDSITVSISKISSIELDTSLLGTDIIIKTYGAGEIVGRKFTKSDAKKIKQIIQDRQNR
ncbi:MAG: hypothetical protein RBS19_11640 [Bacteroidales bacterium]|nr:hypothetical protein [Bacteroidales bacterium]